MKAKKINVRSKTGQHLNDKSKNDLTEETALMEKLKLQNTALEKIKSAVLVDKGISQNAVD